MYLAKLPMVWMGGVCACRHAGKKITVVGAQSLAEVLRSNGRVVQHLLESRLPRTLGWPDLCV